MPDRLPLRNRLWPAPLLAACLVGCASVPGPPPHTESANPTVSQAEPPAAGIAAFPPDIGTERRQQCGLSCADAESGLRLSEEPFLHLLLHDARSIATRRNAVLLSGAGALAIGLRQDVDEQVRENTGRHADRWGSTGETLGYLGHPAAQAPAMLAVYGYGRLADDVGACELAETLGSAYLLNLGATTCLKLVVDTDRPDRDEFGGSYGFPSFHTSSAFTIAAVLDERYGWRAGVPAYSLAAAVGWTRIDQRDHDLSDVVFAAALGYVIGKSVAARHEGFFPEVRLLPFTEPSSRASGVAFEATY